MITTLLKLLKFPVYCGWCGVYLHDSDVENSTGICKDCKKAMGY